MNGSRRWGTAALALAGLILSGAWTAGARAVQDELRSLLPAAGDAKGWVKDGEPQEFAGEDLYTYIDGGAEIYQEYGFRRVIVQDYENAAGKSVSLEIFEMETPAAAFGIFTFKRSGQGKSIAVGAGAELEDYYLNFWKGRFLVTLTGFDDSGGTIEGLLAVAGTVDAKIAANVGSFRTSSRPCRRRDSSREASSTSKACSASTASTRFRPPAASLSPRPSKGTTATARP